MTRHFRFAALATILAALPALAAAAPPAADYVNMAGAGDMYETASSKLVLTTTKDKAVKSFASMMVKDHAKSTKMVKAAARKSDVVPAPAMNDKQLQMINELTAASGPARDQLYWDQQKAAHQEALALHQDYASTGDKPALQAAAGQIVPVVQHHIEMLNTGHSM